MRLSPLIDRSRRENSAEHSWHLAMYALVLAEHAAGTVDVQRVVKMLLIHDIVEIDAGADLAARQDELVLPDDGLRRHRRRAGEAPGDAPAIQVVELARVEKEGGPISASRVRRLYQQRQWSAIAPLVPPGTLSFLMHLAESEHQTA